MQTIQQDIKETKAALHRSHEWAEFFKWARENLDPSEDEMRRALAGIRDGISHGQTETYLEPAPWGTALKGDRRTQDAAEQLAAALCRYGFDAEAWTFDDLIYVRVRLDTYEVHKVRRLDQTIARIIHD